jgi:selenide,water dikinase
MRRSWPAVLDLVLIGGGHTHVLVLKDLAMRPVPGLRVTLVNPGPAAPYSGMLPGHVAGHYPREALMIDLVRLCEAAGARLILGAAEGLDPQRRRIAVPGRPALGYDLASVDIGVGSGLPGVPGLAGAAVPAKPLGPFAEAWSRFTATAPASPRLAVVGAGVAGVELAFAVQHRLAELGRHPQVTLVEAGRALAGVGPRARARLLHEAAARSIALVEHKAVAAAEPGALILADGARLQADFILVAAGARPQAWLAETGLAVTDGFLTVGPTLQTSDPAVFAAGDCAHLAHDPRPKAGVFAVRAAPVLAANLRAAATGQGRLRPYHPQRDYLKLVSLGGRAALADRAGLAPAGPALWRLKDHIDRRFIARLTDLPRMPAPPLPGPAMARGLAARIAARPRCTGCGAKLGPGTLATALAALPPAREPAIITGAGDDAAVLRLGDTLQAQSADLLRAVTGDAHLMGRIAAVHALGDLWATGATPQTALALAILPEAAPSIQAAMLAEATDGAAQVFAAAGAAIVGGHSAAGAEFTLGFAVTGRCGPRGAIGKGGARPGDALVLTKPLGTGTILAALMAGTTRPDLILGESVAAAFASMTALPLAAAPALAAAARAMTDVTGFGLAGHLAEMLRASDCAATLSLGAIPLLPGAATLAEAGEASSLAPENRAALDGLIEAPDDPRLPLLWDPQTAGGLLAAVPAETAPTLLATLAAAGEHAALIGRIESGPPHITVTG